VPDGTYTATIGSTDAVGNVSKATATIEIDSTPPTVSLLAKTIKSNQAVVLKIRDALSGVATATATFDNGHTSSLRDGQEQLVYAPSGGWTPGAHKVVVVATDRAGNRIRRAFTFTVAGLTAEQVAVAADKVLATSPSTSQDRYRVVSCQAVGQITFRGHPASLWQCELKSPLSVGGTTVYAIVVGDTLYLDRSRP
jgi:hypothetical protein